MKGISLCHGRKVEQGPLRQSTRWSGIQVSDTGGKEGSQTRITDITCPQALGQCVCVCVYVSGEGGGDRGNASPDGPDHEVHQHSAAHHHQHGQGPLGHGLVARVGAHSSQAATGRAFRGLPSEAIRLRPRSGAATIAALRASRAGGFTLSLAPGLGSGGAGRQRWLRARPGLGRPGSWSRPGRRGQRRPGLVQRGQQQQEEGRSQETARPGAAARGPHRPHAALSARRSRRASLPVRSADHGRTGTGREPARRVAGGGDGGDGLGDDDSSSGEPEVRMSEAKTQNLTKPLLLL